MNYEKKYKGKMKTKDDFKNALLGYTTAVLIAVTDGDFEEDTFNFWCERLKEIAHKQFEIEAKVKSKCLAQDYKVLDRNGKEI